MFDVCIKSYGKTLCIDLMDLNVGLIKTQEFVKNSVLA